MTKFYTKAFAQDGNKAVIPDTVQGNGTLSYPDGFGNSYEALKTAGGRPVGRLNINGVLYDATDLLRYIQLNGCDEYHAGVTYPLGAIVKWTNNLIYQSQIASNTTTPANTTNWVAIPLFGVRTGTGNLVYSNSPTLVTPALGTPASGALTNCTGLPIGSGVSGLASGASAFLSNPASANLASMMLDEIGTGSLVFNTNPTLIRPLISGVTDGSSAAAGFVGERIFSSIANGSAVNLTSGTPTNVTSISLTAGSWIIDGWVAYGGASSSLVTTVNSSISNTTGTLQDPMSIPYPNDVSVNLKGTPKHTVASVPVDISSTTTYYLVAQAFFNTSTYNAYGRISARRVR